MQTFIFQFMKRILAMAALMGAVVTVVWFLLPGGQLVINKPEKSDAIVVLAGSTPDARYWRGMELLRAGYGNHLFLDAVSGVNYGHSLIDLAKEFVARTAGPDSPRVSVCPVNGDSTKEEAPQVAYCLRQLQPQPHSVILVSDDYHTRRALAIFRKLAPQYRYSAAASNNPFAYGSPWWRHREWAKTYLTETEKFLWWELFDRWRT